MLLAGVLLVGILLPGMVPSAFGDGHNDPPPLRAFCRLARPPFPPEYEPEGGEGPPRGLGGDRRFTVLEGGGGGEALPLLDGSNDELVENGLLLKSELSEVGLLDKLLEGLLKGLPE